MAKPTYEELEKKVKSYRRLIPELKANEEKFSKAFYLHPDSLSITVLETGEFLDINQGFENMFGYCKEEIISRSTLDLGIWTRPSDREKMIGMLKESGRLQNFEAVGKKKSGRTFIGDISSDIVCLNKKNLLITIVHDITERRQMEDELNKTRTYLYNIIDSMPSLLVGVDQKGIVAQWNAEAEKQTGISPVKAIGQPIDKLIPNLKSEMEKIAKAIKTRQQQNNLKRPRYENGEQFFDDITIYPLIANGVKGAVIRIDDVTDQVHIEDLMIQSEKMLSVGGLAAGMAHEINNPLGGIIQTAQVILNRLANPKISANIKVAEELGITMDTINAFLKKREILDMLGRIQASGIRAAEIVQNMLSFARNENNVSSLQNISAIVDKSIELCGVDYNLKKNYDFKKIKIIREYEDNLPEIPCEAGKIQQVLINILKNGAESMSETIKKPSFTLRLFYDKISNFLRIEIEDNGPGMPEDIRKRVFEPFFTTKPTNQGTGLGLSVSYFIITNNHRGEMFVNSQLGKGTTFSIGLPVKADKAFAVQGDHH